MLEIDLSRETTSYNSGSRTKWSQAQNQQDEGELCPLEKGERQHQQYDYVPTARYREHAVTGCPKCALLEEISNQIPEIDGFRPVVDWTNVLARSGQSTYRFDVFSAKGTLPA